MCAQKSATTNELGPMIPKKWLLLSVLETGPRLASCGRRGRERERERERRDTCNMKSEICLDLFYLPLAHHEMLAISSVT